MLFTFSIQGQNSIENAKVSVFSKSEYAAGTQNWKIERDKLGRVYIANNEGLLVYNGIVWQLYPVPNKTILRSIAFGSDGKLYAGAQDEFGYFEADKLGRLSFTSLKKLLPAAVKSFADVWNIEVINNEVYFMTSELILRYSQNKITYFKPKSTWSTLKKHGNNLVAQDLQSGVSMFSNGEWAVILKPEDLPAGFQITDVQPFGTDTSLVSTGSNGLYLFTRNKMYPFSIKGLVNERHFTTLDVMDKSTFLVGSYNTGLYKIDRNGNILGNISTRKGLISNTIRCTYSGFDGCTWIGLDNSIALVDWNNSITHLNSASFNNGSGHGATSFNGNLYFALSTGLQYTPIGNNSDLGSVSLAPKTILDGLTWKLSVLENQLLVGRDDGLWTVSGSNASPVSKASGFWTFQPIEGSTPLKIASGNYLGIQLFTNEQGKLQNNGSIANFNESSRYLEVDGQSIWVSHPYHGLFKIDLQQNTTQKFTSQHGLPTDLENHVFKLKGKIVFATTKGIYEWDNASRKIVPSSYYQNLFGKRAIRYLKEDPSGNIWFVQDKMLGVADFQGASPVIRFIPELYNHILSGFENIYCYNEENTIVGSDIGFYNINYKKYRAKSFPYAAYLSSVKLFGNGDSIIYGGYNQDFNNKNFDFSIPYKSNSVRFTFASSFLRHNPLIEFSYYLEGYDKSWSSWDRLQEKEYTNLKAGKYIFHLKARYGPSNEFKEFSFTFQIETPWYRSIWAYLFYILALVSMIFLLLRLQKQRLLKKEQKRMLEAKLKFEEEQRQINYKHQLKLEKKEKAIIQLKNENLQAEIKHKNEDLASAAMNLLQKKAFLNRITSELNNLYQLIKDQVDTSEIRKIIRQLNSEEKLDEEWEQFSIHFNNVHSDFLITLKKAFPELNAHEMKLCAYLRMNLSSKEIAQLFSISVRGVEISRYRLRKKLKLQSHQDLFEFLMNIQINDSSK